MISLICFEGYSIGDFMNILINWCGDAGVNNIIRIIRTLIDIVRFAVPIGLVIMTSVDIFKKVLNPDDKDGQKTIINRIIAGLLVFFIPMIIKFGVKVLEDASGKTLVDRGSCFWGLIK